MYALPAHNHCHVWSKREFSRIAAIVRILIVDDDSAVGEALAMALAVHKLESQFVLGGFAAVATVPHWRPHAILLDIWMAEADGFQTAKMLRRLDSASDTAIIAHTSLPEHHVRERGIDAGFDGFVQKGYPPDGVMALIRHMLPSISE